MKAFLLMIPLFLLPVSAWADERIQVAAEENMKCLNMRLEQDADLLGCRWIAEKLCKSEFKVRGSHECEGIIKAAWRQILETELAKTDMSPEEQSRFLKLADDYSDTKCSFYHYPGPVAECRVKEYADAATVIRESNFIEETNYINESRKEK